jgi:mono/diheme cytochrome c family protein
MCRRLVCISAFLVVIALIGFNFEKEALSEAGGDKRIIERGRYMSKIAGCNDCHTPGYLLSEGKVPEKLWLTGDRFGWRGPWGTTYAANLRFLVHALTEDGWLSLARGLRTRPPYAMV